MPNLFVTLLRLFADELPRILNREEPFVFGIVEKACNTPQNPQPNIPSHFYSCSFAPKHDWPSIYPGRDKLHACVVSVAERYDLLPHFPFNSEFLGLA